MEERQVTIDGETYALKEPFFVIATQNPIENAGTFPLPEAQMDRFMMRLSMGLPSKSEEEDILRRFMKEEPLATLESVVTPEEIETMKTEIKEVFVHPLVLSYMVDIVQASRKASEVLSGASPRATIALVMLQRLMLILRDVSMLIQTMLRSLLFQYLHIDLLCLLEVLRLRMQRQLLLR